MSWGSEGACSGRQRELIEIGVTREQLKKNIEELYKEMEIEVNNALEEIIIKNVRNIIIKLIV